MQILKIRFENVSLFKEGFEIDFVARDRVTDKRKVFNYHKSFNVQTTVSLIGANATGKTLGLRLINLAFEIILKQTSLKSLTLPYGLQDNSVMIVDLFNASTDHYYRLVSSFENKCRIDTGVEMTDYIYKNEKIYSKKSSSVKNKSMITVFDEGDLVLTRDSLKEEVPFLRDDDSILFYLMNNHEHGFTGQVKSLINDGIMNIYQVSGKAEMININVFDESIDQMYLQDTFLKVKFKNDKSERVCHAASSSNYLLSSGTAKGGNLLYWLKAIIKSGGYLIIDELENHFHKRLVQFVIDLFNDGEVNRKGATLIFSTHYSEILDLIDRKDNIFILRRNREHISEVIRYSDEIKRIENKKSEVYLSNYIKGTSPSYHLIQTFKESIWN